MFSRAHPEEGRQVPDRLRLPRRLWVAIVVVCGVTGALAAAQTGLRTSMSSPTGAVNWAEVLFQWSEWALLAAVAPITVFLARRYPVRGERFGRHISIHVAGALLLCFCWATGGILVRRWLGLGWQDHTFVSEWGAWVLFSLPWSVLIYFGILGSVHAFSFHLEGEDRELRAARLETQLAEARLGTLRAQLQPHFLFNTLNALTVLVRDRRTGPAVAMLDRLSDLLRGLLRADQPHEIPLASELHLVEQYVAIEQVRFADRMRVDYAVAPDTMQLLVPSLVLQPLVENSLRHGLAENDEIHIEIGARRTPDDLQLWVRDHGTGFRGRTAPGVGLSNTQARLESLYGTDARMDLEDAADGGALVRISLPLRPAGEPL